MSNSKVANDNSWQDDLREWRHLKCREYNSSNYPKILERNKRRNELEERKERIEAQFAIEHNQNMAKLENLRMMSPRRSLAAKQILQSNVLGVPETSSLLIDSPATFKPSMPIKPEQFLQSTTRPLITAPKIEVTETPKFPTSSQPMQPSTSSIFGFGSSISSQEKHVQVPSQATAPSQPTSTSLFGNLSMPKPIQPQVSASTQGFNETTTETPKLSSFAFNGFSKVEPLSNQPQSLTSTPAISSIPQQPKPTSVIAQPTNSAFATSMTFPAKTLSGSLKPSITTRRLPSIPENSPLRKWLTYYTDFYAKFNVEAEAFEQDTSQRDLRIRLKRSISEKLDVLTKRSANNVDIANAVVFIDDLLRNKPVAGMDKETIQIAPDNKPALSYAAGIICDKYLTYIKWDLELMEVISIVLSALFLKSKEFRLMFIAKIVQSMVLIHFSLDKIAEKINIIMEKSPEAMVNLLPSESAVFKLFCRLQIILTSSKVPVNPEDMSNNGGIPLIVIIFDEALKLDPPVLLASQFVLNEILNHLLKNSKYKEIFKLKWNELEAVNRMDISYQSSEAAKNLTHGGENFLKSSTAMLKAQFEETLTKLRSNFE